MGEPYAGMQPGEARQPPDSWLARRVQTGDREAFEELARRYLRPIHAVVASFLREPSDIEDAAQDTFLRALDRIHTFDPGRPFAPWLYQIARNVARNRRRALARRRTDATPPVELKAPGPGPGAELERQEIRRLVEAAMERLPDKQRTAFQLFDIEGYAAEEVGRLMGLTAGTVRSHVHHARRALRSELAFLMERRPE